MLVWQINLCLKLWRKSHAVSRPIAVGIVRVVYKRQARRVLAPTKEEVEQYEREVAEWNRVVAAIQAQWERDQVQVVDAWPRRKELMLTLLDEIAASRGALRNRLSRARFSLKHHIEDETKPLNTWSGTADKKTNLGNAEPVPVFLIEEGNIQSGAVPNRR